MLIDTSAKSDLGLLAIPRCGSFAVDIFVGSAHRSTAFFSEFWRILVLSAGLRVRRFYSECGRFMRSRWRHIPTTETIMFCGWQWTGARSEASRPSRRCAAAASTTPPLSAQRSMTRMPGASVALSRTNMSPWRANRSGSAKKNTSTLSSVNSGTLPEGRLAGCWPRHE
jgi:hypothetical protein